jgi:hypothetical protein
MIELYTNTLKLFSLLWKYHFHSRLLTGKFGNFINIKFQHNFIVGQQHTELTDTSLWICLSTFSVDIGE